MAKSVKVEGRHKARAWKSGDRKWSVECTCGYANLIHGRGARDVARRWVKREHDLNLNELVDAFLGR